MSMTGDAVSVRDHMVAQAAGSIPFFEALGQIGVGAIELQIDPDLSTPHVRQPDGSSFHLIDDKGIGALRDVLGSEEVRVSAMLLMTDFSAAQPLDQWDWTRQAVRIAAAIGTPAVRVDPLTRNKELSRDVVRDNFIDGIGKVLRLCEKWPVDLGIENHGPFGNDPVFLDEIFAAIDDPRLGMTLDTGNFYWWGVPLDELYGLIRRYAPRAKHTHIKNINYPPELANHRRPIGLDYGKYCCSLDEGTIDLRRAIAILREAGYQRDLCIENESLGKAPAEKRLELLRRDAEAIRAADV